MNSHYIKNLIESTLIANEIDLGANRNIWEYFNGDESKEEVDKFVNLFKWLEQDGVDVMTMARVCIYLANPTFVNCCNELLEAMEGKGMLD